MPKKKASKRKVIKGGAWYDDVFNAVKSVAGPVNDFLKSTKVISTIGSLVPNPTAQAGARVLGQLGYGAFQGKASQRMKGKGRFKTQPVVIKA